MEEGSLLIAYSVSGLLGQLTYERELESTCDGCECLEEASEKAFYLRYSVLFAIQVIRVLSLSARYVTAG